MQCVMACIHQHADEPEVAYLALRSPENREAHVDLAANGVVEGRAASPVGHVQDFRSRDGFEQLCRHVECAAVAGGAVLQGAGFGFRKGNEFLDVLGCQTRVDDQHLLRAGKHADGVEVLQRVVGHAWKQARVDGERNGQKANCVAVVFRLGHGVHSDVAASAGPVVDHKCLTHRLAPFL